jgi:16S rRNA (uracil1498-N3)-methyltransferase
MSRHESIPRFYVPSLQAGEISLLRSEAHHATGVLRLRAGVEVELFDGRGGFAKGEITQVSRGGVTVCVDEVQREDELSPRLHVAFAVPKGKRLDWLLEKATELGAASLQPVVFERSVAGGEDLTLTKRRRWEGHCISAAKQSGLNWLPELQDAQKLSEFISRNTDALCIVGDLMPEAKPLNEALQGKRSQDVILLIGPEGGFTAAEREAIVRAGYQPVRLGATTLRIETAVVALLAAARAILG